MPMLSLEEHLLVAFTWSEHFYFFPTRSPPFGVALSLWPLCQHSSFYLTLCHIFVMFKHVFVAVSVCLLFVFFFFSFFGFNLICD